MDGVIIINKPKGYTSHDVVNVVRKKLNIKKVGHTGTLDPNATGVLPLLIGRGTKLSKYLIEHRKTYVATLKLGVKTDTGDSSGNVVEKKPIGFPVDIEKIKKVLNSFLGEQSQIPPMYSAIKIKGKKLYEYARKGQVVELEPRKIEVYSIELKNYDEKDKIIFEVECSKGTYIRVLCEDIAKSLRTAGHMEELQRTKVDKFDIKESFSLEELDNINIEDKIISIEDIFKSNLKIDLDNKKLVLFLNGVQLTFNLKDGLYRIYNNKKFVGLGIIKNKILKRDIVI